MSDEGHSRTGPAFPSPDRHLAAIMFTDMAGYTALMGEDEEAARQVRERHRSTTEKAIADHGGTVLNRTGDGALTVFPSATEAVAAAVEIQQALQVYPKIPVRIGLHLGEVDYDPDGAYGDAVNVASRIESVGVSGSVLISQAIERQLANQRFTPVEIGLVSLKNVRQPVHLYGIASDRLVVPTLAEIEERAVRAGGAPAERGSERRGALDPLAVGVLPFAAPAGDADLAALAAGLTDDVTTGLARFSHLTVVSGSLDDDGRATREVAATLGTRYLLQGRLRRSGTTVRLNAQVVDATTGAHAWAETFDRDLGTEGLFTIQDDLTDRVVATVADQQGVLIRSMIQTVRARPTAEMTALDGVFLTFDYWQRITSEDHARTRAVLERVVEAEPGSADAVASLAMMFCEEYKHDYNVRPDPLGRALATARRAVDIDPTCQHAHYALAETHFFRRDFGALRVAAERAVALNRRDGNTVAFMGILLCYAGEWEKGLSLVHDALKLNPHHPGWYRFAIVNDHYRKGEYEKALAEAQALNMPGYYPAPMTIASAAGRLGHSDVARRAIDDLLALFPDFALRGRAELGKWFADRALLDDYMEGLRLGGLEVSEET